MMPIQHHLIKSFLMEAKATKAPHTYYWWRISLVHYDNWLKERPDAKFDRETSRDFLIWLKEQDYGAASIYNHEKAMRALYDFSIRMGAMTGPNPLNYALFRYVSPKREDSFAMTREEYVRVRDNDFGSHDWTGMIIIGWNTGMRMGDIARLKWENIREDRIVVIPNKTAKLAKRIEIPIVQEVQEWLDKTPRNGEYVFPVLAETYEKDPSKLSRWFRIICKKEGIEGKSFHSLRHAFVTRGLGDGMPIALMSSITGQSVTVLSRYMHPTIDQKLEAMKKWMQ